MIEKLIVVKDCEISRVLLLFGNGFIDRYKSLDGWELNLLSAIATLGFLLNLFGKVRV